MSRFAGRRVALMLFVLPLAIPALAQEPAPAAVDPSLFQAMQFRFLGPYRGGRAGAVAGVAGDPHTFYLGASGGLFKTVNAGEVWENVSDDWFEVSSIGAIAVAPSDANVVYVGTGQKTIRSNVSIGRGMYRSTDSGASFHHIGLRDAGQIAKVVVHPRDADVVYVAVIGNPFAPSEARGVFRSVDGGTTWEKVLYFDADTGVTDLAIDHSNPRVLYAAAWTAERKPWTIISGGPDDGLYKSTDSGDTWRKLGGGLPEGTVGKIGLGLSQADPRRLYALVEAEPAKAGLYRSDDAGATWTPMSPDVGRELITRSWYYTHVYADPVDVNRVYVLAVGAFVSVDGGKTFERFRPPHGDGHDLWINPSNPEILVVANDGGAQVSLDRSRTWSTYHNQPTAEIYNVFVDEQFPYWVYTPQQDNSTIALPSRFLGALSPEAYWRDVGGCESAHIGFDPRNPVEFYAGCYGGEITRFNVQTGDYQEVLAYYQMEFSRPPRELRYRFNWNAPIRVSPHDASIVYHAAQQVLRSVDGGRSWQEISPDLTTNDLETQDYSGAPITRENTGAEVYNTIFAFEESPQVPGLLWAGSDDGLVHVSRDAGGSWENVTPAELPARGTVNMFELSAHDPGRIFFTVKRYMLDDWSPYVFRTNDGGRSWQRLTDGTNGIPADTPVRVVREDPQVRGLLYAGTEFGLYVSFDDGVQWQRLQLNLPPIPITDMRVHHGELVVATQGRGTWILDDVTPLHHVGEAGAAIGSGVPGFLFPPKDTVRLGYSGGSGARARRGENPETGVVITYVLAGDPPASETQASDTPVEVLLQILDAAGNEVRRYSSTRDPEPNPKVIHFADRGDVRVAAKAGMNRFVWNYRARPPVDLPDDAVIYGLTHGPRAAPGAYTAKLTIGDWSQEQPLRILGDPRLQVTEADYAAQFALSSALYEDLVQAIEIVHGTRALREQLDDRLRWSQETGLDIAGLRPLAHNLHEALAALEMELFQPLNEAYDDVENFDQGMDAKIAYVYTAVDRAEQGPTEGQQLAAADLHAELQSLVGEYTALIEGDLATFNEQLRAAGAAAVQVRSRQEQP